MQIKKILTAITVGCLLSVGMGVLSPTFAREPAKKTSVNKKQVAKSTPKKTTVRKVTTRKTVSRSVQVRNSQNKRVKAVLGAGTVAAAGTYIGKSNSGSIIYSLMDLNSGEYLEGQNTNTVHSLASLTKLMSSYVFMKNHPNLEQCYITVTNEDKDMMKNTKTRVERNTPHSCNKILQAVLVMSDNWAAHAISRSLPGFSQSQFIQQMNQQARMWGMKNTNFFDPAGVNPRNKSTANDLNILISQVTKEEKMKDLSTRKDVIFFNQDGGMKTFHNTNMLIRNESFDASLSKTGYINESGYNLVFVPDKCSGNKNLALVIMGADSSMKRASFARTILNKYHCE